MTSRRRLLGELAASAVFWLFVTALYLGQILWMASQAGERINVKTAIVWQGGFYLWWIPLTVIVWRLTASVTPSTVGWARYLLRNTGLLVVLAVVHSLLVIATALAILGVERESVGTMLIGQLRGRAYFEALCFGGVMAAGHAVWLYDQWRERQTHAARLEGQLSEARLATLQSQLHPHFLFNSLHAVASLAREGRNAEVVKTVADLSDLLRRVIDPQAPTVPLRDEAELTRRYLDIQRIRFESRLGVDMNFSDEVAAVHVPALTLQPLVDNAVRHGLTASVRGGTVRVWAQLVDGCLELHVDDDGAGVPAGWDMHTSEGTGLANLRSRLDILYGDRASLTTGPGASGGFSVVVKVPAS